MRGKVIDIAPHIDKLVQAILVGATYELAAQFAGVSYDTFLRWRQRAATAAPGTALATLRNRLADAEGRAAIGWLAKIEAAASDGNWQAAAWKLERRYPEAYGKTVQDHRLTIDWAALSNEQLARIAAGEAPQKVLEPEL